MSEHAGRRPCRTPTRRFWRVVFRRARVYLPIVIVLLVAMVAWLPLSSPWLARRIESELLKRTGVVVRVESARVRLIAGEVILRGVALPATQPDEQPFAIREVKLTGPLGELLAGDGGWPSDVEILSLPMLELDARDGRLVEKGALRTLRRVIQAPRKPTARTSPTVAGGDSATRASVFDALLVRTPRLLVRNVVVEIDAPEGLTPEPVSIVLRSIDAAARPDPGDPFTVRFQGTAFAGLAEAFSGQATLDPIDHHADTSLELGGLKRDFTIPGFGDVHAELRGLRVDVKARHNAAGDWPLELEASADEFELSESRAGGEQWIERDLSVAAIATLSADGRGVRDARVGVNASQLDVRANGSLGIDGAALPGLATVEVRELPAPLLALGQRMARSEGVDIVAREDARLRIDLRAEGDFARLETTNPRGSLEMSGWQVVAPRVAHPVTIGELRATISPEAVEIQRLEVAMQDLRGGGTAFVPLLTDDDAPASATIAIEVRGPATAIGDVARSLDVMPREVESIAAPLTMALRGEALLEPVPGVAFLPRLSSAPPTIAGTVAWGDGTVALRDVAGTIALAPGKVAYADGAVSLSNLNARLGELQLNVDAGLLGIDPWRDKPLEGAVVEGSVIAQGPVREALALVAGRVALPMARDDVDGVVRVQVAGRAPLGAMGASDYEARVTMTDGRVMVRTRDGSFKVDQLALDVLIGNEVVDIRTLDARVAEMTAVRASGEVTRERIAVDFDVDGAIKVAEAISPRDLNEMVLDGQARGKGWARVLVAKPLPATGHVIGDWVAAFSRPAEYRFGAMPDHDLRLDLDARLVPGEGATVFHRDLPWPITNIRGDVRADETGFQIHGVKASFGNAHDVDIKSGRVKLGHMGLPIEIEFAAHIPDIDTNEWLEGWGTRPWAERPHIETRPSRWKPTPGGFVMTTIKADLVMASTRFLSVRGNDARLRFEYDVWRGHNNELRVSLPSARVYGGRVYDLTAGLAFPKGRNAPVIDAIGYAENVQMQEFLTDLRKQPDPFVGLFTGHASLKGVLTDKATWTGEGVYNVTDSRFLGEQALVALSKTMNLGRDAASAPTRWQGTSSWKERRVSFPDMVIENASVRLRAKGDIDFKGALDFIVTVQLLGNRLEGLWLIGRMAPLVNDLTDFLVSMRLRGTLWEPQVMTVPLNLDQAIFFRDVISKPKDKPQP